MARSATRAPGTRLSWPDVGALALLWLGGFCLRATMLAVPPMIPAIHRSLGLNEKGVSLLTGLPILLLALAAIPGSLLIARLGARRALVAGMLAIATGSTLRGAGSGLLTLFAMTAVMGAGVAVSQPVFPTLARDWFPARVALATAVYSNGLVVGETAPAALTGPLVAPALGGSWQLVFAAWSLPALLSAVLLLRAAPRDGGDVTVTRRWWPDFRDGRLWRLGIVMGVATASYFGANAFIPDFTRAIGRPGLKDAALASLNASQLLASVTMFALADRLTGRRWPFVVAALVTALGLVGLTVAPRPWLLVCAGAIGFGTALSLFLTLALPPLLAAPADVPRLSAGIFLVMYTCSFLGPVVGGVAWDASGRPEAPFLALAAGAVLALGLIATARLHASRDNSPLSEPAGSSVR